MSDITLTRSDTPFDDSLTETLAAGLRGRVITRADAEYEDARRVWNGMIDKRPLLIVMCAGVADVVAAVNFAREHELPIAVRGGGHNVAGTAVCDDGLVIDLSFMRGVRVDPERRTVWAQGGCTWGDIDRETQPFGLAVPGGVVSETGIAGLTLSGGYSNQRRAHGMTIDNLVACELVTADGRYLRASEDEHSDLFWALRGGGGNFGVVTAFEYRAHPHGPALYQAEVYYPVEQAREILAGWRDALEGAADEITSTAVFWTFPAIPDIPAEMHGAPFLLVIATLCRAGRGGRGGAAAAARARHADPRRKPCRRLPGSAVVDRRAPPCRPSLLLDGPLPEWARGRRDRPHHGAVARHARRRSA